jgi:hypothetical protein
VSDLRVRSDVDGEEEHGEEEGAEEAVEILRAELSFPGAGGASESVGWTSSVPRRWHGHRPMWRQHKKWGGHGGSGTSSSSARHARMRLAVSTASELQYLLTQERDLNLWHIQHRQILGSWDPMAYTSMRA